MKDPRIKSEKKKYKLALMNKEQYIRDRDTLVHYMLTRYTPNWGGLKISLVNH